jgi:hypothetical protein
MPWPTLLLWYPAGGKNSPAQNRAPGQRLKTKQRFALRTDGNREADRDAVLAQRSTPDQARSGTRRQHEERKKETDSRRWDENEEHRSEAERRKEKKKAEAEDTGSRGWTQCELRRTERRKKSEQASLAEKRNSGGLGEQNTGLLYERIRLALRQIRGKTKNWTRKSRLGSTRNEIGHC